MATALLVLAAVEAEPDKTPFYLAGAILVAFAIVLSVIGLRGGEQDGEHRARPYRMYRLSVAATWPW